MDAKRLATGTLIGGAVMLVGGYLIFQLAFGDFYASHAGSATGVAREPVIWSSIAVGTLSLAALVTLAIGWSGASSMGEGFKIGGLVGFLAWLGVDMIFYGSTNLSDLTLSLLDPVLEIVRTGLGGLVIAAVVGRSGEAAAPASGASSTGDAATTDAAGGP